jgi:hypothetical protein
VGRGFTGRGKSGLFCHSERSEESLFDLNPGKEKFLGTQRVSESQTFEFFRNLFSRDIQIPQNRGFSH